MKRLSNKIKRILKNQGSGLVLVIVAVAFIGILVGSLLTAVGYAYRLKLYDYNAKDNFYYLEQTMDDVYAGVGNQTLKCMQSAYSEVINQMVYYSTESRSYVTKDSDTLNALFKKEFMKKVAESSFMSNDGLDAFLQSFISNSDVKLETNTAMVKRYTMKNGKEEPAGPGDEYSSIVIKDVVLTRTANYNRSTAKGEFTQTISADIVVSQPDFEMDFKSLNTDYSTLYDYCMVADNGVEITQNKAELSLSGNVYAAADYYNKTYNNYSGKRDKNGTYGGYYYALESVENGSMYGDVFKDGKFYTQTAGKTLSDKTVGSADLQSIATYESRNYFNFYNGKVTHPGKDVTQLRNSRLYYGISPSVSYYDGVQENSMYSGLYIKGASVNMQSSELIVPGTISVMDGSRLTLYGKTGTGIGESDVWADNIVLGGVGRTGSSPYAMLRANLHVRDDLELDANYSFFQLAGRYYGFGDGTKSDSREYVNLGTLADLNQSAFFYKDENGDLKARGHYNSSAIVINGEQSKLQLSEVNALFVGGRSYVQLSKDNASDSQVVRKVTEKKTGNNKTYDVDEVDENGKQITEKKYVYDPNTNDFKTGESISLKANQLAYIPVNLVGATLDGVTEEKITVNSGTGTTTRTYYMVPLPKEVQQSLPFLQIIGAGNGNSSVTGRTALEKVPCVKYETKRGTQYYYDFQTAFDLFYNGTGKSLNFSYYYQPTELSVPKFTQAQVRINSAEDLAKQFIIFYDVEYSNYHSTSCKDYLEDIGDQYEGFLFDQGYLQLPVQTQNIYSSGAISSKAGTEFTIVGAENLQESVSGTDRITGQQSEYDKMFASNKTTMTAAKVADDMESRYAYVKWALENYNPNDKRSVIEQKYVDYIVSQYGEGYLTPINRFLNFNQIELNTDIHPGLTPSYTGGSTLKLGSGYSVWLSDKDVVVSSDRSDGVVQGIVITKGNVFFDNSVSKFEGLIVSGDKIFVDNLVGAALPTNRGRSATGNQVLSSISASPEVVRSILNECISLLSDSDYGAAARSVLRVFKSYEPYANMTTDISTVSINVKTIDTIQYSDVVRYANWMKNVADVPKKDS